MFCIECSIASIIAQYFLSSLFCACAISPRLDYFAVFCFPYTWQNARNSTGNLNDQKMVSAPGLFYCNRVEDRQRRHQYGHVEWKGTKYSLKYSETGKVRFIMYTERGVRRKVYVCSVNFEKHERKYGIPSQLERSDEAEASYEN